MSKKLTPEERLEFGRNVADLEELAIGTLSAFQVPGAAEFAAVRKGLRMLWKTSEELKDAYEMPGAEPTDNLKLIKSMMKTIIEEYVKRKLLASAGISSVILSVPQTKALQKFIIGGDTKRKSRKSILKEIANAPPIKFKVPEEYKDLEKVITDDNIREIELMFRRGKFDKYTKFFLEVFGKRPDLYTPPTVDFRKETIAILKKIIDAGKIPKPKDGTNIFEKLQRAVLPKVKYCGSGTPIIQYLLNGVEPADKADLMCFLHDLDYLKIQLSDDTPEQKRRRVTIADMNLISRTLYIDELPGATEDDKATAQIARASMISKITAESTGALDPLNFVSGELNELNDEETDEIKRMLKFAEDFDEKKIKSDIIEQEITDDMPRISIDKLNEILDFLGGRKQNSQKVEQAMEEALTALRNKKGDRTTIDLDLDVKNTLVQEFDKLRARAEVMPEDPEEGERLIDPDDPEKPKAQEEREAEVRAEEGEGEKVSEERKVLEEDVLKSLLKEPPRPSVSQSEELKKASHLPFPGDEPIIGERSMRPLLVRQEGDQVELSHDQIKQNRLWLDNFNWIDPGFGNGNQERVPWNFTGGKANNSLYEAQEKNAKLRFSGDLNEGAQYVREKEQMSRGTYMKTQIPFYPNIQNEQKFIRNGALPAGLGRPIQMMRANPEGTAFQNVNSANRRLVNPDIIRGQRAFRRV